MTGYALATALAAPVEDGMMLAEAARPARQSLPFMEPSTVSCEAVAACTVVMRPLDAELLVDRLDQGREAVGGARGARDDGHVGGV